MQGARARNPRSLDQAFICFAFVAVVITATVAGVVVSQAPSQAASQTVSRQFLAPLRNAIPGTGSGTTQTGATRNAARGEEWPEKIARSQNTCPRNVRETLGRGLEGRRKRVRNDAARAGTVSWAVYSTCPACHAGKRVEISGPDFAQGTLRIQSPGLFVLTEDAVVEPNAHADFRPDLPRQNALYGGPAYVLGFFTAITVESDDVVIDLQGHTLQQSVLFATEQRFFALITLAGQPFIAGQGPADFGPTTAPVDGVTVENGTIGRSAHHGIHGNGGQNVLLQDLTFTRYEVAAIALNGFSNVLVRRCTAAGSETEVPVLGTYSNARILLPFAEAAAQSALVCDEHRERIAETARVLRALVDEARGDVALCGKINGTLHPEAYALFGNPTGLNDGNAYGFAFHPLGISVNGFWNAPAPGADSPLRAQNIFIDNCTISGTQNAVVEVVVLRDAKGHFLRGPAGDMIRVHDNTGRVGVPFTGEVPTNALALAQAALMEGKLGAIERAETEHDLQAVATLFGTTHGGRNEIAWLRGETSLHELVQEHAFTFVRNGDSMFHVNKGVIGLRLDGTQRVCVRDTLILDTQNTGPPGVQYGALPGEDTGPLGAAHRHGHFAAPALYHPFQGAEEGYAGADAQGVTYSGAQNLYLEGLTVRGVRSTNGNAYGLRVFNAANGTHVSGGCVFSRILAASAVDAEPWRGRASAAEIARQSSASVYGLGQTKISEIQARRLDHALAVVVQSDPTPLQIETSALQAQQEKAYGVRECEKEK